MIARMSMMSACSLQVCERVNHQCLPLLTKHAVLHPSSFAKPLRGRFASVPRINYSVMSLAFSQGLPTTNNAVLGAAIDPSTSSLRPEADKVHDIEALMISKHAASFCACHQTIFAWSPYAFRLRQLSFSSTDDRHFEWCPC